MGGRRSVNNKTREKLEAVRKIAYKEATEKLKGRNGLAAGIDAETLKYLRDLDGPVICGEK